MRGWTFPWWASLRRGGCGCGGELIMALFRCIPFLRFVHDSVGIIGEIRLPACDT